MDSKKEKKVFYGKGFQAGFIGLKILQPVFNALFYVSLFFVVLLFVLSLIILIIDVGVDQLLLSPFMNKITDAAGEPAYSISFGNGIRVITGVTELGAIKSVIFAEIFVIIFVLLTAAPVFRFLALLLKNISSKEFILVIDAKNPKYIMYIGLCICFGNMLIQFVMRFYNYLLAAKFITDSSQEIKLSLGVSLSSGLPGLAIIFIGLILAYVFERIRESETSLDNA